MAANIQARREQLLLDIARKQFEAGDLEAASRTLGKVPVRKRADRHLKPRTSGNRTAPPKVDDFLPK